MSSISLAASEGLRRRLAEQAHEVAPGADSAETAAPALAAPEPDAPAPWSCGNVHASAAASPQPRQT